MKCNDNHKQRRPDRVRLKDGSEHDVFCGVADGSLLLVSASGQCSQCGPEDFTVIRWENDA